jgi:hypothetical protein
MLEYIGIVTVVFCVGYVIMKFVQYVGYHY